MSQRVVVGEEVIRDARFLVCWLEPIDHRPLGKDDSDGSRGRAVLSSLKFEVERSLHVESLPRTVVRPARSTRTM